MLRMNRAGTGAGRFAFGFGLLVAALAAPAAGDDAFIVRDGAPRAQIVIAENPTRMQKLAAGELRAYVRKITGADLPVVTVPSGEIPVRIYVGRSAHTDRLGLDDRGLDHGAYRIKSGPDYLVLLGSDADFFMARPGDGDPVYAAGRGDRARARAAWEEQHGDDWGNPFVSYFKGFHAGLGVWAGDEHGSLNAVNDFLRSLGVEWYLPGDLGEVLPRAASIPLPTVDRTVRPEFARRAMSFYFNAPFEASAEEFLWQLRLGLGGREDLGGHGIMYVLEPETVKQAHPEYFALYDGRRETENRGGKPCCSSEGLLESALGFARLMFDRYGHDIVSLMPTDGYSALCGCALCAGKGTPERERGSLSDYVWSFINAAGRAVEKTHPDKKVSCYAYGAYLLPPEKIAALSPNVAVGICQNRASFHQPETRDLYRSIRDGWLQKLPAGKFAVWDYYLQPTPGGLWAGLPVYFPRLIAEDLRSLKGIVSGEGIEVYRSFSSGRDPGPDPALAANHLNCWVTARLWWNPDQDVDALLDDYCRKFYGPAADEMKQFIEFSEQNWPVMGRQSEPAARALDLLEQARQAAGQNGLYARRVQLVADYVERPLSSIVRRLTVKRAEAPATRLGEYWGGPGPIVDGKPDEPFWEHTAYCNVALRDCLTGGQPRQATHVQAVWAFGALHFAIRCQEPDTAALNTPTARHDDPAILDGDHVSLLLETPDHAYYEIAVAPNGAVIDIDRKDGVNRAWTSKAEVAVHVGDGFWSAEIRLPVLDEAQAVTDPDHAGVAGGMPNPTLPWFFNYGRQRKRGRETDISARYPTGEPSFYNDYHFGLLQVRRR